MSEESLKVKFEGKKNNNNDLQVDTMKNPMRIYTQGLTPSPLNVAGEDEEIKVLLMQFIVYIVEPR